MGRDEGIISWWRTDFTEEDICKIGESVRNGHISMGKVTEEFESRLAEALSVPYVVAVTSGSSSLLVALMALGIEAGDEVIVPNRTWIATVHAPLLLGAKPVLVDVLPDRPIMDTSMVREKITARTKAIMPVQLNGSTTNMEDVWEISREFGLSVVEDAAQALFSKYQGNYVGTQSDAGCFSLAVSKLIPTGQGGFVATQREDVYRSMRRIRTHGVDDVVSGTPYLHMGFNFRYTDILASIGLVQLGKVDARIDRMNEVYDRYKQGLAQIDCLELIPVDVSEGEVPLYVHALCDRREALIQHLSNRNIQARPFYPDLDSAPYLSGCGEFPNTKMFGEKGLVLPCGPDQPLCNVDKVLEALNEF